MTHPGLRNLPTEIRTIVENELTDKQLEAFDLECSGIGLRRIGWILGISRSAVSDRLEAAHLRLHIAGVRQDGSGNWYLERKDAA